MKVLQLTCHFVPNLGGVETHLSDLVLELARRDFKIFVLSYRPLATKTEWKLYEKQKNLFILRIPWISGWFYRLVKNPILEFLYLVPGLFIITPFVLLLFRPRIIHSHGLAAGTAAVFWGKIFKKRVIVTTHSIYHFPEKGLYRDFVRWLFKSADHILALSNQSKKEIESLGIPPKKISVFTYWVDQKHFRPLNKEEQREKYKLGKSFIILFVGRLIAEKGILVLLDAFKQLRGDMKLLVAGDGPLRDTVAEYAKAKNDVLYLGRVEQENLPFLYNASDVLAVPSVHEEGFGRVILESLSCGMPVIASNRGGIREAMDESVGRLITVNAENLVLALKEFYNKRELFRKKREKIASYAKKRFGSDNIDVIINAYEK